MSPDRQTGPLMSPTAAEDVREAASRNAWRLGTYFGRVDSQRRFPKRPDRLGNDNCANLIEL